MYLSIYSSRNGLFFSVLQKYYSNEVFLKVTNAVIPSPGVAVEVYMSRQRSVPRDSEPRPSSRPVLPPCHLVYEFDTKFQLVVKPRTSLDNSEQLLHYYPTVTIARMAWDMLVIMGTICYQIVLNITTRFKCCGTHFVILPVMLHNFFQLLCKHIRTKTHEVFFIISCTA